MARNKKTILAMTLVVASAVVIMTGGLMASNMGFKLNYQLLAGSNPGSNSGTQTIALPYNRQVGIDTSEDLFGDIGAGNVQNVQKFLPATDTYALYSFGSAPFALNEGEGYIVKMQTDTNYIIVGSHNPAAVIQLDSAGASSLSGTNLYAHPYHGISSKASELFQEIGTGNVQNIQAYLTASDTFSLYSFGSTDFDLAPGQAYVVKMQNSVAFSPAHY